MQDSSRTARGREIDPPPSGARAAGAPPEGGRSAGALETAEEIACVAFTVLVIVAVGLQVFYRYVLQAPLIWTDELARYSVVWLTFAGAALTGARGGHIAIELGDRMLGERGVRLVAVSAAVFVAATCAIMIFASIGPLQQVAGRTSVVLGVPLWFLTAAAPTGFALMGLHALTAARARLAGTGAERDASTFRGTI